MVIIGLIVPLYTVLRTYFIFQICVVFNYKNGPVDLNFNTEEVYASIRNVYVQIKFSKSTLLSSLTLLTRFFI